MSALVSAYDDYLDEHTFAATTEASYRRTMGYLSEWLDATGRRLVDCKIRDIKDFVRSRAWGNSQTRLLNAVIVPFVRWRYGDHPLTKWRVRHESVSPQRTLSLAETEKLLASFQPGLSKGNLPEDRRFWICDTNHPLGVRNLAIVWMLIDTGFRSREICRLALDQCDLSRRSFTALTKGGKYNLRFFTEQAEPALFAWLRIREKYVTQDSGQSLFIGIHNSSRGKPLTHSGLRVMLRKLGEVTDLAPLSPHVFRRTKATLMQTEAGAPSRLVQVDMDWRRIEEAERYSQAIHKEVTRQYLPGTFLFKGNHV